MDEFYLQYEKRVLLYNGKLCRFCLAPTETVKSMHIPVEILTESAIPQLFENVTSLKVKLKNLFYLNLNTLIFYS